MDVAEDGSPAEVYRVDGRTWRQNFEAELLDEDGLPAALASSGLSFTGWLDRDRGWLEARLS